MLRPDTLHQLQRMFPGLDVGRVRVSVAELPPMRSPATCLPRALASETLETAAVSLPGHIIIRPKYAQEGSRAFLGLVAHEMVHQQQYATIPGYLARYRAEQTRIEALGLPPWANVFETPAYRLQWQIEGRSWG